MGIRVRTNQFIFLCPVDASELDSSVLTINLKDYVCSSSLNAICYALIIVSFTHVLKRDTSSVMGNSTRYR